MPADSAIDWQAHKAVVFESDDWGNCGMCPDPDTMERVRQHPRVQQTIADRGGRWISIETTLEQVADLDALFDVLQRHRGADGQPAVFTAFYPTANPDYDAIRKSNFTEYHDIPIDAGWSQGWRSDGSIAAARDGMSRGLWCPEFHARLHHCSPKTWLEILRGGHDDTDVYRMLFDNHVYEFDRHLPEYERMTIREQLDWLRPAVDAFERAFGVRAMCAVNSDAIPGTEESYALCGIRTRCLKSVVLNNGRQVRPYGKGKPDSVMDATNPMGRYNRFLDLVYLNRNAFFEVAAGRPEVLDEGYQAILGCWQRGEPAVVSTHCAGYCSNVPEVAPQGRAMLDELLGRLIAEHPDMVFMTSWEVAQLCRVGTSAARYGESWVLRNYGAAEAAIAAHASGPAVDLRSGREFAPVEAGAYRLPPGDYKVG